MKPGDEMRNVFPDDRGDQRARVIDGKTGKVIRGLWWRRVARPGYVVAILESDHDAR